MGLEPGLVIDGKYRISHILGEGGMGAVYAGENLRIKRKVAIKVLHPTTEADAHAVARFEREAQAAGHIGNDHILEVLDVGQSPDGSRYMVMELLEGESLRDRIARIGRMTPRQIYPLVRQLLDGLGAAHSAKVIHRDLKPDNVFILREKAGTPDYVKIIDFGISKFQPLVEGAQSLTRTGSLVGTPLYLSPEQARGGTEADARSDLYAVGVILYEAVTGRLPFTAGALNELLFSIVLGTLTPPEQIVRDLDPEFAAIVRKAMAREPLERFQTAGEFAAALDGWARGDAAPRHAAPVVEPPNLHETRAESPISGTPGRGEAASLTTTAASVPSWDEPPGVQKDDAVHGTTRRRALTIGVLVAGATAVILWGASRRQPEQVAAPTPAIAPLPTEARAVPPQPSFDAEPPLRAPAIFPAAPSIATVPALHDDRPSRAQPPRIASSARPPAPAAAPGTPTSGAPRTPPPSKAASPDFGY